MRGLLLLLAACGGPPEPPEQNDPAYNVDHREWSLIGNALTLGHESIDVSVSTPSGAGTVSVWLDGVQTVLDADNAGTLDVRDLGPGSHVLVWADGNSAFAATTLVRSHPYYVLNGVDWDSPDTSDAVMTWQDQLHEAHPELLITHFVGPYTWTDPALPAERQDLLRDWLMDYRDDHGDEIALHIHPYCHFVATTDVPCQTEPSFAYADDSTGYTVPNWAYTQAEFEELLVSADDIFVQQGFDKPTSYRAGGWSATTDTLRALHHRGYVADTSANNWERMEEWQGSGTLYSWNAENWATITETSQPYYPDNGDILNAGDDPIGILEVPDNGILVDYVGDDEMIEMFEANWDGGALDTPTQFTMGWHDSAYGSFRRRIDRTLEEIDEHLAANGDGPVVYETLSNMTLVWPAP